MQEKKFTIVVPIKDEVDRLNRSLPSFYRVNPDEVIICTDYPSPPVVINRVNALAKKFDMKDKTKILPVKKNADYSYHQAWVRRAGFTEAKNDIVLTTDIDLDINNNILKAVNLVGENGVGLVSLSKFRQPYDISTFLRAFGYNFLRLSYILILKRIPSKNSGIGLQMTLFTGLYAFYKPYWLKTEDEGIKKIVPTAWKQKNKKNYNPNAYNVGEDNYLRDCMERKYRVIYLAQIGAIVIDRDKLALPGMQIQRGRYSARRGRSLLGAIVHSIIKIEPNYLKGFLSERRRLEALLK